MMRYALLLLILLPGVAFASPTEFSVAAAPATPAGVAAVVYRGAAGVVTACTAALVDCRHAVADAACVAADTDPRTVQLFFPRLGLFDVEAVVAVPAGEAASGVVLLRVAQPLAGSVPYAVPDSGEPDEPAFLAGFGRHGSISTSTGLACTAGVAIEPCTAADDAREPRLCWRLIEPEAAVAERCDPDRDGLLFVGRDLAGVMRVGGGDNDVGMHRPLAAAAAFLRNAIGTSMAESPCGMRARVSGPAAQVSGFAAALDVDHRQADGVVDVPSGTKELIVTLEGVAGTDFDLFLKHASPATIANFACGERGLGSYHACRIADPAPGRWFVLVSRVSGEGRFQATATVLSPPCADPVHDGRACDDENPCTTDDRCANRRCVGTPREGPVPCDDGNACTSNDRCVGGSCVGVSACGDGIVDPACEECDDGNDVAGDGCENDCRATRAGAFVGYTIRPARTPENRLPREWNLRLDDRRLRDGADDPENYSVEAPQQLLLPAALDEQPAPSELGRALLRYRVSGAREGAGTPDNGRFPRAARHESRQWKVDTDAGSVVVESKAVAGLLVPARIDASSAPTTIDRGDAYACYTVRVARGIDSALAPDGRFVRGLQRFLADAFGDCAPQPGGATFPKTRVAGKCLYDLQKPVELCNPVAVAAVEAPRRSAVPADAAAEVWPSSASGLLCFQAQRATRVRAEESAALVGVRIGEAITPRQPAHRKRLGAEGAPLHVHPGIGLPAPTVVDTMRPEVVCVPALASVLP